MNGYMHISAAFEAARTAGHAALMPYYTLGYPSIQDCPAVIAAIASSGADLIELGLPFSDPLADGPTIQRSTQAALQQGMTMRRCLEMVAELRRRGVHQPFLLMGYINPLLAYGLERFVQDAAASGADGLIVPDLPPEEAGTLEAACRAAGLALVFLLAPTSTPQRIALVAARSSGFIYLVSVAGITGARQALPPDLSAFVLRVRAVTAKPLAVGFGISTPAQARSVGQIADGVIVGSALINATGAGDEAAPSVRAFVSSLSAALQGGD